MKTQSVLTGVFLGISLSVIGGAYAAGDPAAGEATFNKTCKTCHATGMLGAPKVGDKAAWAPRIAKGEDALLQSVISGLGKMLPRGGCKSCSDQQLADGIAYILGKSQ